MEDYTRKAAKRAYDRAYYAKHAEERRQYQKEWREKHPDKVEARKRSPEAKAKRRERRRRWALKNPDAYKALTPHAKNRRNANLALLAGRPKPECCDVCADITDRTVFDHSHQQGHFRGWLCHPCNIILGLAKDSPDRLRKLIAYLERSRENASPQLTLSGI
jgi:hypothetical protein